MPTTPPRAPGSQGHELVGEVGGDPRELRVYEHGWQSWSPSGLYPGSETSPRPRNEHAERAGFRPHHPAPPTGFQSEGLLAVVAEDGATEIWCAPEPWREVPSIRAEAVDSRIVVTADGPVAHTPAASLGEALAGAADTLAAACGARPPRPLGPGWCSWYAYWGEVTEGDVLDNLAAIDRLGLDVAVVQVDDGHQADIGDWLDRSPRFGPLDVLAARIADTGREAGIWTAPFLVSPYSQLATEHPDWLLEDVVALRNWGAEQRVLDVTHPDAAEHLHTVYRTLREQGFSYHKIDFCYAGAMDGPRHAAATGLDAYKEGLGIIREALGDDATLLGCGAPLLPSIGHVDAMRVSPDIDPVYEPAGGDLSQPSQRGAVAAGRARRWMHGRWWINDPDCLIVRPEVANRRAWARHVEASRGLIVSSDPLDALDETGLAWTRALLRPADPTPVPDAAPALEHDLERDPTTWEA